MKDKQKIRLEELGLFKNVSDVNEYLEIIKIGAATKKTEKEKLILERFKNSIVTSLKDNKIDLYKEILELGIELDIDHKFKTEFSRTVINQLMLIKPGTVKTYSEIGKKINSQAYRAIGNVCRSNPYPLIIPCHRVVRKDGRIGGFMGKTDKVWETSLKKRLLNNEGFKI